MLAGLMAAFAVPALGSTLVACGEEPPDPLVALVLQARTDATLAEAAAQVLRAESPATVETLTALAAARRAHADDMARELGEDAPPPPPPGEPGPPAPDARNALSAVRTALQDAQRRAAAEVPALPRHRAAMVGSIAACCAAYRSKLDGGAPVATPDDAAPASTRGSELAEDADTAAAVQTALGAEHAAVWCYGLASAFLPATLDQRAEDDAESHRDRRDVTAALLTAAGLRPVAAEPAYRSPAPVTDQRSAVALALVAESDAAAAWRSVLERCEDPGLRRAALDALSEAATRAAYWSDRAGIKPVVPPFPGLA